MQDITPTISIKTKIIESYGAGGFKISGNKVEGSVMIFKEEYHATDKKTLEEFSIEDLLKLDLSEVEILLVGFGESSDFLSPELEKKLGQESVKIEYMNTGAASRTYNVLVTEERNVAALLIAV